MRPILSLFSLVLLASPVLADGYGRSFSPGKFYQPPPQLVPVERNVIEYRDVPRTVIERQKFVRQEIDYVQVQPPAQFIPRQKSSCAPAAGFAPGYGVQASFGAGKGRGLLPGRGLFGGGRGRGQDVFRQRTFFRGSAGGVQAQFGAY